MEEKKAVAKVPVFNIKPSLANTKKIATELTKFIKDNKLSTMIAGKDYTMVEGWQFAGSQLNLVAIPGEIKNVSTDTEIKYVCSAQVFHIPTGTIVSRGFALCSNKESKKKSFDEYAIASMAQTRAIGKAYRNNLSWLMKLAGFEGTPAEEMDKDAAEEDLGKIKANVFARFKALGITDTTKMLNIIQHATGKQSIDNSDDAMDVLSELSKED